MKEVFFVNAPQLELSAQMYIILLLERVLYYHLHYISSLDSFIVIHGINIAKCKSRVPLAGFPCVCLVLAQLLTQSECKTELSLFLLENQNVGTIAIG